MKDRIGAKPARRIRICRFLEKHPEIDTRIAASLQRATFSDGVDRAIRYLLEDLPEGTFCEALARDAMAPLCSPHLRNSPDPLLILQDLAKHTLIHLDAPPPFPSPPGWSDWLKLSGAGIALGYKITALNDLLAGRLVIPFGPELPAPGIGYHFVRPAGAETRPPHISRLDQIGISAGDQGSKRSDRTNA